MWILRILGPIKISNGPLKFGNLHVFEWDMGHWPVLRAHHHYGLGLTLLGSPDIKQSVISDFILDLGKLPFPSHLGNISLTLGK